MRALSRVLSGDKVIHSKPLNVLGAQVLRALAARAVYTVRPARTDDAVRSAVDELNREGLLLLPDFLSPDHLEGVVRECAWLDEHAGTRLTDREGPNTMEVIRIEHFREHTLPHIHRFFGDHGLNALLRAAERWPLECLARYGRWERLTYGQDFHASDDGQEDPQTRLHSDIFFNSHKAWLFLDDVRVEDGPFVYVKRSHRLSFRCLSSIYRDSCRRRASEDPSRRISPDEQERLGLAETIVTCRKNTLVIANVCGYHRRLQGQAGRQRHALSLFLRNNPFLAHALRARLARHALLYKSLRRAKQRWVPR